MIRTLTINSYRNTRPCTLHFDPRLTVVLGENSTGRSELLEIARDPRRHGVECEPLTEPRRISDDYHDGSHWRTASGAHLLDERQHILTTQNPSLIDVLPFDDEAQLQRRLILTSRVGEEFVWRNPTAEEAARVARSLRNGVMHVSEILRAEGLW